MQKYTFNMVCTDDTVGGESRYKRIKLVGNVNGKEKTIKLCGPCIGSYSIIKQGGHQFFELWAGSAKYNFREGDFCDG
ncbi:MAG: hypothetical protein ACEY3A_00010 [Wolbachia sp.]